MFIYTYNTTTYIFIYNYNNKYYIDILYHCKRDICTVVDLILSVVLFLVHDAYIRFVLCLRAVTTMNN